MTKEQIASDDISMEVSFENIKNEIIYKSRELKEIDSVQVIYSKCYRVMKSVFDYFIRIHRSLSKNQFYRKSLGALVLFLRSKRSDFQTVRFSTYLTIQDEVFIEGLYKDVLKREVDPQSFVSMMSALQSSVDARIDIGYDLNHSHEATLSKMYIQGVYMKKVVLDLRRDVQRKFSKPASFLLKVKNRLLRTARRNHQ